MLCSTAVPALTAHTLPLGDLQEAPQAVLQAAGAGAEGAAAAVPTIDDLPAPLITEICRSLTVPELAVCGCVSKGWLHHAQVSGPPARPPGTQRRKVACHLCGTWGLLELARTGQSLCRDDSQGCASPCRVLPAAPAKRAHPISH